jgi:hypothetical protein
MKWTPAQATTARMLIEQHLAPRREQVRKAMLGILLEAGIDPRPSVNETLARVHDLCAKELAERVRIAADDLKRAYASGPETSAELLLEDLRLEVEQFITGEMADLVDDERLAATLLGQLPRFLSTPRPTSL